jgi:hypothetical protein
VTQVKEPLKSGLGAGEIEDELWEQALRTALNAGYMFNDATAGKLRLFIREGARRLVREGALEDPSQRATALANVERLVMAMIEYQEKERTLGQGALQHAKRTLCPLWPFC